MNSQHVVVIGAGAIGTASAWYLKKAGWSVTLIDKDRQGRGATAGNCGLFSPSHAMPLAVPGAIKETMHAFFRTGSPLSIRPRIDFRLWAWLMRFAKRCNREDMLSAAPGREALIRSSGELYRELREQEDLSCEWKDNGCLMIYQGERGLEAHGNKAALLRELFGIETQRLDAKELDEFEPALIPGQNAGAWFYEGDSHMRPEALLDGWRDLCAEAGVEILDGREAKGFHRNGARAKSLKTNQGDLEADAFVLATGAWAPELEKEVGASIPIQPGKGYSLTMPRPAIAPKCPLIFEECKVVATPFDSGYRLGSTMEFAGYDTQMRRGRLSLLEKAARRFLREPMTEPIEEEWYGWRPMTFDGKPILDRSPRLQNLVLAAGHSMLGLTMAPATGKLVAEMLSETTPHLDIGGYSLTRF
jgi:D-amino-acid dehydrogenase